MDGRSDDDFEQATARAERLRRQRPTALAARWDRRTRRVAVRLSNGLDIGFRPRDVEGLQGAGPDDLAEIVISPSGFGLHFPKLDADVYLPALLDGLFGSPAWMAARLGQRGGRATGGAKAAAARRNGALGGRPPKAGD